MIKHKKLIALTMAAAVSFSMLPAVTSTGSYATDGNTGASNWTPAPAPAPAPAPKPAPAPAPKPAAPAPSTSAPVTSAPANGTSILRLLVEGSFGEDVKLLQTLLNKFSFNLSVDGFFGKLTAAAVRTFQGANGLAADGIVGPKTLAKLAPVTSGAATSEEKTVGPAVDTVATASIVDNNADFEKAIGKDGFWLAATLKDLTFTTPLVLDGNFVNDDGKEARKIALYTQDADHNVIDNFTLKAPKLTIQSPSGRIQNGAFVGDLYVNAAKFEIRNTKITGNVYVSEAGFKMTNAKIEGNVHFTTQAAKDGAIIDAKSTVSGEMILVQPDVVTTASLVDNADAMIAGLKSDGKWIVAALRDIKTDKEVVINGTFTDGKKDAEGNDIIRRKLAFYSQDEKRNITRVFTLTAPKVWVNSPNTVFQGGIFNGDVYVNAKGFNLVKQTVNGNIYFMTQEAKDTFKTDAVSKVNGEKVLIQVDAVTNASLVDNVADLEKGISTEGTWILSISRDLAVNKALVMDGEFENTKTPPAVARKLALYSQDADHKITRNFTLMAQRITVKSPNARIQGGIFDGNVYVEGTNFQLVNTTVDGNVYVSTPNFKMTNSKIVGNLVFMNAEAAVGFTMDEKSAVTGTTSTIGQ